MRLSNIIKSKLSQEYDIIFVCFSFLDEEGNYFYGGAEIHLRCVCDVLTNHGKKILVIQRGSENKLINKDSLDVLFVKTKSSFLYKFRLARILKKINSKTIHFNYFDLDLFVRKHGLSTYSATHHGVGWDFPTGNFDNYYIKNNVVNILGSYITKRIMVSDQNRAIKKMDRILSVDTSLVRYCQQFFTRYRDKIDTVFNFVDLDKFRVIKNDRNEVFTILYPRNISPARGVHLLVPLCSKLLDLNIKFKIKIVGSDISEIGGNRYEVLLKKEIIKRKLDKYFEFTGRVPHDDMPMIFSSCDLVIIPSFYSEGTSLSCLEAMASNKIVLATNIGGLNDLIIDGYNGYLSKPSVDEIASKIKYIYENLGELDYIKRNALDILKVNNSFDIWSDRILKFFSTH